MASPLLLPQPNAAMSFDGHPSFSLENVYRAYRACRKRKRSTINALRFERDLEENVVRLHEELAGGTYRPGRSVAFLVEKPKRREIFAADFRDRVVHHILVGTLEPKWERRFIHDSYACRPGKGTHRAVDRLRSFTRKATANGAREAWYLQLDVRGFFTSIDRAVLFERLVARETDPAVRWLAETLVFHDPVANCVLRGARREQFEALPSHKTLFKAPPGRGLPIGNLTSQFFANVYLDALDQFVKHELRARFYVRYCDDLVLVCEDRARLEECARRIEQFLRDELYLELNEKRRLRPVSDGIDFLGYIVRPDYLLVRRRVVGALRERLDRAEEALRGLGLGETRDGPAVFPWPGPLLGRVHAWLCSYLGHFRRASARRLLGDLWSRHTWLYEYFEARGGKLVPRCPVARHARRLGEQVGWFRSRLPGHVLILRLGRLWRVHVPRVQTSCGAERVARGDALRRLPVCFPDSRLPVAWIDETETRLWEIAERALVCRWSFAGPHACTGTAAC